MDKLKKLRKIIIDELYTKQWREVWFFPRYKNIRGAERVMGYLGTDQVVFLSINPSFGSYPSAPDIFYYKNLQRQGFANAHLTDLFKFKIKNNELKSVLKNKNEVLRAIKILGDELKIINPKIVVCVGKSYSKLYKLAINNKYPLYFISHYAPQFNNDKKRKQFRTQLRAVRIKYNDLLKS